MKKLLALLSFLTLIPLTSYSAVDLDTDFNGAVDMSIGGTNAKNASDARTNLGLVIGLNVQGYDVDLTTYAGISPSASIQSFLASATFGEMRAYLDLEPAVDIYSIAGANAVFQPKDINLPTWPSSVDATEVSYLNGLTSNIQIALDAKQNTLNNEAGLYNALSDVTIFYEPGDTIQTGYSFTLPGTCTNGELYIDGDEAGGTLYACAGDAWVASGAGGGGGDGDAPTDAYYYVTTANGTLTNEVVIPAFIQTILDDIDEATFKATVNLEIGTDIQAYDGDLTTYAGITPSSNIQSFLGAADYATMRSLMGLEYGVDIYTRAGANVTFQPIDPNMILWPAAISATEVSYLDGLTDTIVDLLTAKQNTITDESGLYAALSDVSIFYEPGDTLRTNSGITPPGSCTEGEIFIDTNEDTDGSLLICVGGSWKIDDDDGGAGGGVSGPGSSTDDCLAIWDGTGGALLKDGNVCQTAPNDYTFPGDVTITGDLIQTRTSGNPTSIKIYEDPDDGNNYVELLGSTSASDRTITAAKILETDDIATVTNKDLSSPTNTFPASLSQQITVASKSSNYTIGTDSAYELQNGIIYVSGAATITAPAVSTGKSFTVVTIGAVAVSLDVNASDRMYLDGVALDDGDKATNTSTTGDIIYCAYESAAGWYCASGSPDGDHWTDGGP